MLESASSLFERHSIDELSGILVKIRTEAGRKKFDLARMVGESYKDVIDAADAIGYIKSNTDALLGNLNRIKDAAIVANSTILSKPTELNAGEEDKTEMYGLIAKIRLLVITPEQIWHAMESDNLLCASRIFLIARLVFSNLQSSSISQTPAARKFKMVKDQWDAIGPLKNQIITNASNSIKHCTFTRKSSLLETLCAIGILQQATVQNLFHMFLDLRKQFMFECLVAKEEVFDNNAEGSPNKCITDFLESFLVTIREISELFATDAIKLQMLEMGNSSSSEPGSSSSSFSNLYTENSNVGTLYRYLPSSIKNYTPSLNSGAPLSNEAIAEQTVVWATTMTNSVHERVLLLLAKVQSGSQFGVIRENILQWDLNLKDENTITSTFGPNFSLWEKFFERAFFTQSQQMTNALFTKFFNYSSRILEEKLGKGVEEDNANFNNLEDNAFLVWSQSSSQEFNLDEKNLNSSPALGQFSHELQETFDHLLEEMKLFLGIFSDSAELAKTEIHKHLESDLQTAWTAYISNLNRILKKIEEVPSDDIPYKCILVGRSTNIVQTHVESIINLFYSPKPQSKLLEIFQVDTKNVNLLAHRYWIETVASNSASRMKSQLLEQDWTRAPTNWEPATPGSSNTLPSAPSTPSVYIMSTIFLISSEINKIEAFLLSQECNTLLGFVSFKKLSLVIMDFLSKGIPTISEEAAIQLLFDYSFLIEVIGRVHHTAESLKERENLKANVLETIWKLIHPSKTQAVEALLLSAVPHAYAKTATILNPLGILNPSTSNSLLSSKRPSASTERHQMLNIAPAVPRFALLPVSVPSFGGPMSRSSIQRNNSITGKSKPKALLSLRPPKRSSGEVPLGFQTKNIPSNSNTPGATRVQGLISAVAGLSNIATPKANSEFLTSASNMASFAGGFVSNIWGGGGAAAGSSSPKSSPKRLPR